MNRVRITGLLFFLSGSASLVYQVLWSRQISLVFGNTLQAASATVAAFLLGLGLGAALAARVGRQRHNIGRDFACAEILVAISGLLVSAILPHGGALAAFLSRELGQSAMVFATVRFLLVWLLLLVPCICMGVTLPLLTLQAERVDPAGFGKSLGVLYAVNTLGAACGALATDFLLIPAVGVWGTVCWAACLDLAVGGMAWYFIGRSPSASSSGVGETSSPAIPSVSGAGPVFLPKGVTLTLLFLSGTFGLALEIVWVRALVFINSCEIYAFSMTLFIYLVGIVIGGYLAGRFLNRVADLGAAAAWLFWSLGILSAVSLWVASLIPLWVKALPWLGSLQIDLLHGIYDACVMLPATACLGALFTVTQCNLRASYADAASSVGRGYLINTLGSLLGSLATGYLLVPYLGMQTTLLLVSAGCLLTASWLTLIRKSPLWAVMANILTTTALLFAYVNISPQAFIRSFYENRNGGLDSVISLVEDHYGTVGLVRHWGTFEMAFSDDLIIDNYNMAANDRVAKRYTAMLALTPQLCSRDPQDVLVICFGLANTLTAAVSFSETRRVDCVELSPQVVETTRQLEYVKTTLASPKLKLIFGDGRNYLLRTERSYDVITAEPPPPHAAGIVNLYTREYYQLCRDRLKPGGIVAQWLPTVQMSAFEVKTIIRAFCDVFPSVELWMGVEPSVYLTLVGSMEPFPLDYERVKQRYRDNPWIALSGAPETPAAFAACYLRGSEELRAYVKSTPPLTDDRPYLQNYVRDNAVDEYLVQSFAKLPNLDTLSSTDKESIRLAGEASQKATRMHMAANQEMVDRLAICDASRDILVGNPDSAYLQLLTHSSDHFRETQLRIQAEPTARTRATEELARIAYIRGRTEEVLSYCDSLGNSPFSLGLKTLALVRGGRSAEALKTWELLAPSQSAEKNYVEQVLRKAGITK